MNLCLIPDIPKDWEALVSWGIKSLKGNSLRVSICKLAWWATVYHLWLHRSSRIHGGVIKTEEQLIRDIKAKQKAKFLNCSGTLLSNVGIL